MKFKVVPDVTATVLPGDTVDAKLYVKYGWLGGWECIRRFGSREEAWAYAKKWFAPEVKSEQEVRK